MSKQTRVTPTQPTPVPRRPTGGADSRMISMLVLGGAFVLLAGLALFLTNNPAAPVAGTPAVPTVVVWNYESATANELTVQTISKTVSLQVRNGAWQITAPIQHEADDLTVTSSANVLKKPDAMSKVGDNVTDLKQYGLDTPAITVTIVLSGATPPKQTLYVGNASVDGSAYYVRANDSKSVYLLSSGTIEPIKSWLDTPPIAQPTPTPFPTLPPTTAPITGTLTVTGTTTLPGPELPTAPPAPAGSATAQPATAAPAGTPSTSGTQPPVGGSPVSSPPSSGPGASPAPTNAGGGPGGTPGTVTTPTP